MGRSLGISFGFLIATALCSCAFAQPEKHQGNKRAWEWTREERIARRFDPSEARARKEDAVAQGHVARDSDFNVVLGDRDPELLMPWELMDRLVTAYTWRDDKVKERYRRQWFASEAARQFGEDFYSRLQEVLLPFLDATSEAERLQAGMNGAAGESDAGSRKQWQEANHAICPSRAKALSAAREIFGRAAFDRFLYEAVAPGAVVLTSTPSGTSSRAELEAWIEGGCR